MDSGQQSLKNISKVALAALGVLLVGSLIFYKERVFFSDASFVVFNVINYKSFYIQASRYGSFITQVIPHLFQKANLPIKAILVGYSISFNLFYLSVAFVLYRFRQYKFAILMTLYYFLFVSDSYFWTNNEIHQAIAWMFLFYGVTIYYGKKEVKVYFLAVPFLLLAFLTVSTHFVVIIPMVFLWVYLWIEKENWPFSNPVSILFSIFLVAIIGLKYAYTETNSYDERHLHGVTHFSLQDIFDSFTTSVVKMFFYRCLSNYWLGVVVFILSVLALIKSKKYILLTWTMISCLGYFIIMGLTYSEYDSSVLLFHIESEWASISIIIALPFVFEFLPNLKPVTATWLLISIFTIRLVYIYTAVPAFRWRVKFEQEVLLQMRRKGIEKLALIKEQDIQSKIMLDWGIPDESILLSALNGDKPEPTFLFINKDDEKMLQDLSKPEAVSISFDIIPLKDLNSQYFVIDTTHPYKIMTFDEFFK